MSYHPLVLDLKTPPVVESFVRRHLDMQFNDLHCMLRLPLYEFGLDAGCNFAAANSLLAFVSGLSVLLTNNLSASGQSENLFKKILLNYYPWDLQLPESSLIERCIDHLYDYFRNPLAHSLGIRTKGNFLVTIAKNSLAEAAIERLEQIQSSPGPAVSYTPIRLNGENIEQITLEVANFYWGVRGIVRRLSADAQQMLRAERDLKSLGWI